jgi:hypothetical protein
MNELERISLIPIGSPVTNICTSESSPLHHMKFAGIKTTSYKNKYDVRHTSNWAKCKAADGRLHSFEMDVIYEGHLSVDKCKELWEPVWQRKFGKSVSVPKTSTVTNDNKEVI